MQIQHFFDHNTSTLTYVVFDEHTRDAVIIDSVLDFDQESEKISDKGLLNVVNFIRKNDLDVHYILDTHAHADHLTGACELKKHFPHAQVAISEKIQEVQKSFKAILKMDPAFKTDGSQFDVLLKENTTLSAGSLKLSIISTPGHTPACLSYLIEDAVFVGDALFMPDGGTGRCDFPGGSAKDLYHSIQKLYSLPDATRLFVGHDYQPNGRELRFKSTVGESKKENIHLSGKTSFSDYVLFRETRDKTLAEPKLIRPSLHFNIQCGPKTIKSN